MRPHLYRLIGDARTGVAAIGKAQEIQRVFTGATYHSESDGGGARAVRFGYAKADRRVTATGTLPAMVGGRGGSQCWSTIPTGRDRPRGPDRSRGAGQAREAATELLGLAKRASLSHKWWVTSRDSQLGGDLVLDGSAPSTGVSSMTTSFDELEGVVRRGERVGPDAQYGVGIQLSRSIGGRL